VGKFLPYTLPSALQGRPVRIDHDTDGHGRARSGNKGIQPLQNTYVIAALINPEGVRKIVRSTQCHDNMAVIRALYQKDSRGLLLA
jgi:hypothetical protein